MEHLEDDDSSYKAYRNSEAEASQSTSKNALSSQVRKGLKLFAQTCHRFQIPIELQQLFLLHFYVTLKLSSQKKRNYSLIKAKSGVTIPKKEEPFRAVAERWHHNQCKFSILIFERTKP